MTVPTVQPKHSVMADRVAAARAAHQLLDAEPLIFRDPLAVPIVGAPAAKLRQEHDPLMQVEHVRRMRTSVAVRSAFAEEEVARAMAAGASQYVVLGAGLDTFAYRRADVADR